MILFWQRNKEKQNVSGNYSIDHRGVDANRCNPGLAAQQGLGLWPKRRYRADIDYPDYSVFAGTIVMCPIKFAWR